MAFAQMEAFAQREADLEPNLETARVIPQKTWNAHRREITELYIQEETSLADLRKLMEDKYNLKATYAAPKHP